MGKLKLTGCIMLLILCGDNIALAGDACNLKQAVIRLGYDGAYILTAPLRMDSSDVKKFLLFSGVTYGLMSVDKRINEKAVKLEYDKISAIVEPTGGLIQSMGVVCLSGLVLRDNRWQKTTLLIAEAALLNASVDGLLKKSFGRSRPFESAGNATDFHPFSSHNSFPSGHTSTAFTVAQVISNQYPSPWVKISAYTFASLVGIQRLNANVHYTSDVFAGAMLGMWVGNTICTLDKHWEKGDIQFSFDGLRVKF
ncbi:phosphatase PAP2 family protein [Candidatus Desantisbacteria bacterium]|nr:phosphatase PAP2 family protein [Candidatus Desantisbacteria bacterium]